MDAHCPNPSCGWEGEWSEAIPPDPSEVPTFPADHPIHDARFCPECGWQVEVGRKASEYSFEVDESGNLWRVSTSGDVCERW